MTTTLIPWLSFAATVAIALLGAVSAAVKMLYGIDKRLAVIEAVMSDDLQQAKDAIVDHDRRLRAVEVTLHVTEARTAGVSGSGASAAAHHGAHAPRAKTV